MARSELMDVNSQAAKALRQLHADLETHLHRDVIAVLGPIMHGADKKVRDAIEAADARKAGLAVILNTNGGVVEVTERMVQVFRHYYTDVAFIIPDAAMSAGTVLAMSGDEIMMDFFSCLGPIDPQRARSEISWPKRNRWAAEQVDLIWTGRMQWRSATRHSGTSWMSE